MAHGLRSAWKSIEEVWGLLAADAGSRGIDRSQAAGVSQEEFAGTGRGGSIPRMENYRLVMPEHLNHYGFLFGGHLLQWIDELAWMAASLDYPGCRFVTVGMDKVEFRKSVRQGVILHLRAEKARQGKTSVTYAMEVTTANDLVFSTHVTLVRIDESGQKLSLESEKA